VTEVLVTVGLIGLATTLALPSLLSYWRAATLTAGAQELQTVLNSARQLAIRQNTSVCVERSGNLVRFRLNGCGGTIWTGPGTDPSGWIRLANAIEIVGAPSAPVVFSYLGAATPAGTFRVRNPADATQTLTVTVAASGRITIP